MHVRGLAVGSILTQQLGSRALAMCELELAPDVRAGARPYGFLAQSSVNFD